MKEQLKGESLLFLAALIWGVSFVFQKTGMDYVGPMTFGLMRFGIGSLATLPFIFIYDHYCKSKGLDVMRFSDKTMLKAGLLTGLANFGLSSLQQIGLVYTTAGKAGFISAMYVAVVPILMLFLRRKIRRFTWFCIAVALVGLYLLCMTGSAGEFLHLQLGDGLVLGSSVFSAAEIILIDHYADKVNPMKLSFMQFVIAAILSGVCAFAFETVEVSAIIDCRIPILYTGLLEIGAAYTLQIFGQKTAPPVISTIIMSLESVFAVLSGAIFLHEVMSGREITGCVIMFIALLLIQITDTPKGELHD
ncbi:MAG: DMT family transporter [Clostridiales bacterium]|nr:DMT family transporter [Clostridiales bacterium]